MEEFKIKSVASDLTLLMSDLAGDYFKAQVISEHINVVRDIYAYTDAYGFANFMEHLASFEKPWANSEQWETLEGEFKLSAVCNPLGQVTFKIELNHYGKSEEWVLKTQLKSELGQLPMYAKSARAFFKQETN